MHDTPTPGRLLQIDRDDLVREIVHVLRDLREQDRLDILQASATAQPDAEIGRRIDEAISTAIHQARLDESRQVTILLSDLRGFTATSERVSARQLVATLNRYLACMTRIIVRNGGVVDKFMGDAIMVLFGAPKSTGRDVSAALACAIEMQLAMDELNQEIVAEGMEPLFMGIGVNTGEVFAGHLGSELHSEYTVIGDEVNLAARIEAHSLRGQILISERTWELAREHVEIGEINEVRVKGKKEPVRTYELLATHRPATLRTPVRESRKSPRVEVELPLNFQRVQGKIVEDAQHAGWCVDLSYGGVKLVSPIELEAFADLKLRLKLSATSDELGEIYAKVRRVDRVQSGWAAQLEFTAIEPASRLAIKQRVDEIVQAQATMLLSPMGIGAALRPDQPGR